MGVFFYLLYFAVFCHILFYLLVITIKLYSFLVLSVKTNIFV